MQSLFFLLLLLCTNLLFELRCEAATPLSSSIGLGASVGSVDGAQDYRFVVDGYTHFEQEREVLDLRRYGANQARLELGSQYGITLKANSGVLLYSGGPRDHGIAPAVGVEALSGSLAWQSNGARKSFYEWSPAASAGVQLATQTCQFLGLARAGLALGNRFDTGLKPTTHFSQGAGYTSHVRDSTSWES